MNLHSRTRNLGMALAVVLFFPVVGAWAQGGSASASKVAVINVRTAIVTTAEGKQASAQLNIQFTPRQTELEQAQKQIQDLQNRLNSGARTLSDDEKTRLQRQGELLARQFQRKQDDMNEEVTAAQAEIVDTIGRKMFDVIDRYARENGYAVVLDSSAQGTPVVYASSQIDITQEIVRLFDQAYPLKSGGQATPAQKPSGQAAASRPGATTGAAPKKPTPPSQ